MTGSGGAKSIGVSGISESHFGYLIKSQIGSFGYLSG